MPWFEIVYSMDPTSKALSSLTITARDRTEAAGAAMSGLANAQAMHGAKCFRVMDGMGMVVARGPKGISTT